MSFLKEVTRFWGHTTLIESDPSEEVCASAIYAPFRPDLYFSEDPGWGIYHREGPINQAAAYYPGPVKTLVGQSQKTNLDPSKLDYINEEFVYGGPILLHFGHFITTTLSRLWYINESHKFKRKRRILCHAHEDPPQWYANDFAREILGAMGLAPEDFVRLKRPSLIRRLWIPRPAMEEQHFVHRTFDRLATKIGRNLGVQCDVQRDQVIFLSKTRLASGVTNFAEEHMLENHLATRGVKIVHPQELSFPDRLQLFAGARVITGTASSALHSCLFTEAPCRIVALTGHNLINSNFVLIDRLKTNDSLYLYPEIEATRVPDDGGRDNFLSSWSMDMESAAVEFADRI